MELEHKKRLQELEYNKAKEDASVNDAKLESEHKKRLQDLEYEKAKAESDRAAKLEDENRSLRFNQDFESVTKQYPAANEHKEDIVKASHEKKLSVQEATVLVLGQKGVLYQGLAVLGGGSTVRLFELDHPSPWSAFIEYLRAGIWHIWSGFDHLLFLLSLLLPAVLARRRNRWEAVPMAAPAFVNIVKVVTAFTLAHSITLSLAALDVIRLPSRLTESVIAASIMVAALNNVFPHVTEGRWRIAFAFGLLHGFGFASVLAEMGLPKDARLVSLVAFNLGVEAGQLAVVLAVMPAAYLMRSTAFYRRGVMPWGSSAIAAMALVWFVQRASG